MKSMYQYNHSAPVTCAGCVHNSSHHDVGPCESCAFDNKVPSPCGDCVWKVNYVCDVCECFSLRVQFVVPEEATR